MSLMLGVGRAMSSRSSKKFTGLSIQGLLGNVERGSGAYSGVCAPALLRYSSPRGFKTFTRLSIGGLLGEQRSAAVALNPQRRGLFIIAEATPNPESVMFYPQGNDVLGQGARTKTFSSKHSIDVKSSLLANSLFKVHGVAGVMLASRHVTITKSQDVEWEFLQPNIELVMSQFFAAGLDPMDPDKIEYYEESTASEIPEDNENLTPEELEKGLIDLLEERVQPFVQQDGGDVEFVKFEPDTGLVWLRMMGACQGCPKSSVTLNLQIKQLITHYYPQVKDVVEFVEEEEIPRGH